MDAAATAREEASSRWRLVLTAAPRAKPHAYLYDGDAGPYATPRWEFDLEPYQEIPPIEPGACVDAEGQMRRGARPVLRAGNVTIRPGKGLRESRSDRMLVARGDVVAHPRVAGPNPSWRYVSSHSLTRSSSGNTTSIIV